MILKINGIVMGFSKINLSFLNGDDSGKKMDMYFNNMNTSTMYI
jgi:hypothetical protein